MQLDSVCSFPVEELLLTRVLFRPDGHHIVIGHRDLILYEVLSGKQLRVFPFDGFVAWTGFSSDGRYLAAVNEDDHRPQTSGLARVFEVDTGELLFEARTRYPVQAGCFREGQDGTVFLYADPVAEEAAGMVRRRARIRGVRLPSLEPDCEMDLPDWRLRYLAAGRGLTLVGLDTAATCYEVEGAGLSCRRHKVGVCSYPEGNPLRVRSLGYGAGQAALSRDGMLLALERADFRTGQRQLYLIDIEAGTSACLLPLPAEVVPAFSFSDEGEQLLSLNEDPAGAGNLLRLWETGRATSMAQTTLGLHYHAVALNWPTHRIAALGGGKCDVGLIRTW